MSDTLSISSSTLCAKNIYNAAMYMVSQLHAQGYHIVIPTCIPRGGFNTTTNWRESARLYYNNLVTSNAAANGYTASDRCSVYPFNGQTFDQSYYWTDNTHCLQRGLWTFGQVDLAAILSA